MIAFGMFTMVHHFCFEMYPVLSALGGTTSGSLAAPHLRNGVTYCIRKIGLFFYMVDSIRKANHGSAAYMYFRLPEWVTNKSANGLVVPYRLVQPRK